MARNSVITDYLQSMTAAKNNHDPEKAVEKATNELVYRGLAKTLGDGFTVHNTEYPHNTDGLTRIDTTGDVFASDHKSTSVLVETKRDKDFSHNRADIIDTVCQVVAYLHVFREKGDILPAVTVISDEDEVFLIPTKSISSYTDSDTYDWSLAPSSMKNDTTLWGDLYRDENIAPFIRRIHTPAFSAKRLVSDIVSYVTSSDEHIVTISVTITNMVKLFNEFNSIVFDMNYAITTPHEQVELFMANIRGGDDRPYIHPAKKNTIVYGGREYPHVNTVAYEFFWNHYDNNLTVEELKQLTSIVDQILEDSARRFTGEFFTPRVWVEQAYLYINRVLTPGWRQCMFVWDPACGTKNLTRDYIFAHLFSSTIHGEELDIAADYNIPGVAFPSDFLNDDVLLMHGGPRPKGKKAQAEWEKNRPTKETVLALSRAGILTIPAELIEALYDKKPIVVFMNPPRMGAMGMCDPERIG